MSRCLDLDAGILIPELQQAEEAHHTDVAATADQQGQAARELAVDEMDDEEAPTQKRNGRAVGAENDFSDLLPVSICSTLIFLKTF